MRGGGREFDCCWSIIYIYTLTSMKFKTWCMKKDSQREGERSEGDKVRHKPSVKEYKKVASAIFSRHHFTRS